MKDKLTDALLLAIGEVDDDLIEEATVPSRHNLPIRKRTVGMLAACLAVAIGIGSPGRLMNGGGDLNGSAPESSGSNNGSAEDENSSNGGLFNPVLTHSSENGEMTLTDSGGYRYTFNLTITEEHTPISAVFTLYRGAEIAYAVIGGYTNENISGDSIIGAPLLLVDGVEAEAIPTEPGEYEIYFDLSEFISSGYDVGNRVLIYPFGEFDTIAPLY